MLWIKARRVKSRPARCSGRGECAECDPQIRDILRRRCTQHRKQHQQNTGCCRPSKDPWLQVSILWRILWPLLSLSPSLSPLFLLLSNWAHGILELRPRLLVITRIDAREIGWSFQTVLWKWRNRLAPLLPELYLVHVSDSQREQRRVIASSKLVKIFPSRDKSLPPIIKWLQLTWEALIRPDRLAPATWRSCGMNCAHSEDLRRGRNLRSAEISPPEIDPIAHVPCTLLYRVFC